MFEQRLSIKYLRARVFWEHNTELQDMTELVQYLLQKNWAQNLMFSNLKSVLCQQNTAGGTLTTCEWRPTHQRYFLR